MRPRRAGGILERMRVATGLALTLAGTLAAGTLLALAVHGGVRAATGLDPWPSRRDRVAEQAAAQAAALDTWTVRLARTGPALRAAGWRVTEQPVLDPRCHEGSSDPLASSGAHCGIRSDAHPLRATAELLPDVRRPGAAGVVAPDEEERRVARGRALLRLAAGTERALATAGWECDGGLTANLPVLRAWLADPLPHQRAEPFEATAATCTARAEGVPPAELRVDVLPPWRAAPYEENEDPSVRLVAWFGTVSWQP